jgi:hypothetical protein
MTVDERNRLQLAEAAKRVLGNDEGITLMELLPSIGLTDLATKQDLQLLEYKVSATLERELRSQTWRLFAINAATMGAVVGALIAIAKL